MSEQRKETDTAAFCLHKSHNLIKSVLLRLNLSYLNSKSHIQHEFYGTMTMKRHFYQILK